MSTKTNAQKKTWTTPQLVVYGDVEKITTELPDKVFGSADGAIYSGQSVMWAS